jgi:hypothetical protein
MYVSNVYEIRDKKTREKKPTSLLSEHRKMEMEKSGLAKRPGLLRCSASQRKNLRLARGFSERGVNWLSRESGGVHGNS